ncbi:MAG TPA: polyribonucleotide nucleotidyltransferase, partial [Bacteroidota bacterium]|nr:polyribonucleotide nucleotidyltransferase [Bacteroidota bacterium]
MVVKKEIEIGGQKITLETGRLAKQADGAVLVCCGETMVLATVVANKEAKAGQDFFPLQVEYREKTSAAGKIPGGFFKREGRPTEKEILSSRLIDRPLRPMFAEDFKCETQVMVTVYSSDQENDGDVLGAVAASAALVISDIPLLDPIAEVRVGRTDGKFIVNPKYSQLVGSDMDILVAGTSSSIVMVEGEAREISETDMLEALRFAHANIKMLCEVQMELRNECGRPKRDVASDPLKEPLTKTLTTVVRHKVHEVTNKVLTKEERSAANDEIKDMGFKTLTELLKNEKEPVRQEIAKLEGPNAVLVKGGAEEFVK